MASDRDGAGIATQIRLPGLGADEIEPPLEADKRKVYVGRSRVLCRARGSGGGDRGGGGCVPVRPCGARRRRAALAAPLRRGLWFGRKPCSSGLPESVTSRSRHTTLLSAIVLQQQGKTEAWRGPWPGENDLRTPWAAMSSFVGCPETADLLREWSARTEREHKRVRKVAARPRSMPSAPRRARLRRRPRRCSGGAVAAIAAPRRRDRDALRVRQSQALLTEGDSADPARFRLRAELEQLGLLQGFDELLCLPALHGVQAHWYQIETVRKVLKQFRGRVLLADEVGLGKTIEAGMVLKEYCCAAWPSGC